MSKQCGMSKTQYLRLQGYLYDLHVSGKVCVFSDFSGHVDWLQIRIATNKKDYLDILFSDSIYMSTDYKPRITDKRVVDETIADIEKAVNSKESKLIQLQKEREASEKAQYERLKAKYEAEL